MDFLNLPRLIRTPELVATLPNQDADEAKNIRPTIVFRQTKPLRNRIFNYTKTLNDLDTKVWNNIDSHTPCCCTTTPFSNFVDKAHGHVITGNLDIVSNTALREMLKLGPKFRDRVPLDWDDVKKEVFESLDSLTQDWANKLHVDISTFNQWKVNFRALVTARLELLQRKFINPPRSSAFRLVPPFLSQPSVCNALKTLHKDFVLVPADKAEGNVIVICKRFYVQQVIKELQPDEQSDKNTFEQVYLNNSDNINIATEVITTIEHKMKELKIPTEEAWSKLASFYWTAKMHKTPVGSRFITASNRCAIKPVSQVLTQCFRQVLNTLRAMHNANNTKDHIWITDNADAPRRKLKYFSNRKAAKCVSTFDFSTLYTKIQHKDLEDAMKKILTSAFEYAKTKSKSKKTQHLKIKLDKLNKKKCTPHWVNSDGKSGKTKKGKYLSLSCDDVMTLFKFLLKNSYILVGDKVFRQIIGIPMGTDCAPYIANLFLYYYENKWMNTMKTSVEKKHQVMYKLCTGMFRYIDDLLALNNPNFAKFVAKIYPKFLVLNKENKKDNKATFLDLEIKVHNGRFITNLYDKRDAFDFDIVKNMNLSGNVPFSKSHGVVVGQLLRFALGCHHRSHFISRARGFINRLQAQHFSRSLLRRKCVTFYDRYTYQLLKFGFISLEKFITELFK